VTLDPVISVSIVRRRRRLSSPVVPFLLAFSPLLLPDGLPGLIFQDVAFCAHVGCPAANENLLAPLLPPVSPGGSQRNPVPPSLHGFWRVSRRCFSPQALPVIRGFPSSACFTICTWRELYNLENSCLSHVFLYRYCSGTAKNIAAVDRAFRKLQGFSHLLIRRFLRTGVLCDRLILLTPSLVLVRGKTPPAPLLFSIFSSLQSVAQRRVLFISLSTIVHLAILCASKFPPFPPRLSLWTCLVPSFSSWGELPQNNGGPIPQEGLTSRPLR